MHVVVVGCGRVGAALACALSAGGDDVVVIDRAAKAFLRLGTTFNGVTLRGAGSDEEILLRAGIDHAEALAAVTNSDSANMVAAEIARRMYHVKRVVVRLYMPDKEQTAALLGLDYVGDAGLTVKAILGRLAVLRGKSPAGQAQIVELIAGPGMHGRSVGEVQIPDELRVCLVHRAGSSFIPREDDRLQQGDTIHAAVRVSSLSRLDALAAGQAV